MDENKDVIEKYELLLKENSERNSFALYEDLSLGYTSNKDQMSNISRNDVLLKVHNDIKSMQGAECCKYGKKPTLNKYRRRQSSFLPVNTLAKEFEQPLQRFKFETQPCTDTQLIDIVQDAEINALAANCGMTQEFESSFFNEEHTQNMDKVNEPSFFPILDITLKEPHNVESKLSSAVRVPEPDLANFVNIKLNNEKSDVKSKDIDVQNDEADIFEDDEDCGEEYNLSSPCNNGKDIDLTQPGSSVFTIKTKKTKPKETSFTVDLESFEKFEKIAQPIIECSAEFETAKKLINSQIFGRQLHIQTNVEPYFSETESISPIIELSNEILRIDKSLLDSIKETITETNKIDAAVASTSKELNKYNEDIFKDDILFSSDEESDYLRNSFQDLPFTCALETSFYDHSNVLEKTMYVGFQTASNKSIRVDSESFSKAKCIFDDIGCEANDNATLSQLVKMCDNNINIGIIDTGQNTDTISGNLNDELGIENNVNESNQSGNFIQDNQFLSEHINNNSAEFKKDNEELSFELNTQSMLSQNDYRTKTSGNVAHAATTLSNQCEKQPTHSNENINSINAIEIKDGNENEINIEHNVENIIVGFKTASNKAIDLSDNALAKAKSVLQDLLKENTYCDSNQIVKANDGNCRSKNINSNVKETNSVSSAGDTQIETENIDDELIKEFEQEICMSSPKTEKGSFIENNDFIGFKTANNKKIRISDDALKKSKKLLEDIEFSHYSNIKKDTEILVKNKNVSIKTDQLCNGFKTASNKDITISHKAMAAIKDVFKDIDFVDGIVVAEECNDFLTRSNDIALEINREKDSLNNLNLSADNDNQKSGKAFPGFKTASNKDIHISSDALRKTQAVFRDVDKNLPDSILHEADIKHIKPAYPENRKSQENSKESINLKTSINVKEDKLSDDIEPPFYGFDRDNIDLHYPIAQSQKLIEKYSTQFNTLDESTTNFSNTASNKRVKISEEGISKTKNIFNNINDDYEKNIKDQESSKVKSTFKGFMTASNKEVKISDDSLEKSRNMLKDIVKEISNNRNKCTFAGFQTANNKTVKISDEALAISKKLFQDIDREEQNVNADDKKAFKGFKTANNKKIKISNEALAKSRKLFQDMETHLEGDNNFQIESNEIAKIPKVTNLKSKNSNSNFEGFQTASNKKVTISKEALAKTANILQEFNLDPIEDIPSSPTIGFQTASNKRVNISKDAVIESRKLLRDVDNITPQKKVFCGFQTANNKEVVISETALARSRQIFNEINKESNNDVIKHSNYNNSSEQSKKPFLSDIDESKNVMKSTATAFMNTNDKTVKDAKDLVNFDSIINTQVLVNFDEILNTEDFLKDDKETSEKCKQTYSVSKGDIETPKKSKRSGSPILSCPKPKRRKVFHIPYSQKVKEKPETILHPKNVESSNVVKFTPNYKKRKEYTLKDLQVMENTSTGVENIDIELLKYDFNDLLTIEFSGARNEVNLASECNEKSTVTSTDLKNLFLNSVNKKLVPENWVEIQMKLIIWKLISYERRFPKIMQRICTAKNVLDQLKYRYDKELYNAERPALRKIFEKDDTSARLLCLCVVDILQCEGTNNTTQELLLSDGWYCIKATIDKMLGRLLADGKIKIGLKLMIQGAELVGSEQAVSPWEDTNSIRLKLSGNSTRRAHWATRLGYHGNGAILSQLSNVCADGGKVAKLRVFVTRVYPALYVEKFDNGSTVTRSERLETIHHMKYESERQNLLEKLYEEVEKEIYDQESQDSIVSIECGVKRKWSDSGSQMAKMLKRSKDPTEFSSHLTLTQNTMLNNYTAQERDKLIQRVQERVREKITSMGLDLNRNVVPLLKIRVCGFDLRSNDVKVSKAMLSIWKPNDGVIEMIREGVWIEILNVVPTAVRYSEMQISAGRQSVFSLSKYKESDKITPYIVSLKRTCYPIRDLVRNPAMTTDYNEVDTVGIVFQIDPSITDFDPKKHQFQNVYLSDIDKNIVCVNFWGGIKKIGFENVLDTGQVVAGVNLQKRAGNTRKSVPQYRATEFTYFTKTPKNLTARNLIDEISKIFVKIDRRKFLEDCVRLKNNFSVLINGGDDISPYRFPNMNVNLSTNRVFLNSPLARNNTKMDDNLNLTGLDFESTFKQTDTQELSPKTLLRKKQVQQKIAKLKMYGEPPPLSPMQIINKSKNATSAYKNPLISKSDVSPSVAREEKMLPIPKGSGDPSSPVISLNRTYVKRNNVNPVKLNFSRNVSNDNSLSEIIDDFAEEFDGSPPLSLD